MSGIEIITIGGEIVSGRTPDSNFLFLARGLRDRGLSCRWHTSVPDDAETLGAVLRTALQRAQVVLATGGLGPTTDDITRKVLATVLKRQLVLREDLLAGIVERYERGGRKPPANLQAQALIPFGAELIPNDLGTAAGLKIRTPGGGMFFALPGVPHEMEPMAERFVLPEIESLLPGTRRVAETLRIAGISESALAGMIRELVPRGVTVAYLPQLGTIDLKLSVEGDPAVSRPLLDRAVAAVAEKIGDAVYARGEEELEETIGRLLSERGWSLAVAESLTGGGVAERIVRVAGSSRYFLGGLIAYDNRAKVSLLGVPEGWIRDHGAVSQQVAEAMAHGVRGRFDSDVGVSTTGVAGPGGGSAEKPVGLVHLGIAWPGGRVAIRRRMAGGRKQVIERTVAATLDLVRRVLLGTLGSGEVG